MVAEAVKFLAPERARYLVEMAERAREGLSRFVGYEADDGATALQDRPLLASPAFLGVVA